MEDQKCILSFVIPCYRSEFTIQKVIEEIAQTVSEREAYDYEIICVNDCSPDHVYDVLETLAKRDRRIKVVNLAKNMGKHAAVLAGYAYVNGAYIVNLDDDCQCPTYELWNLLRPVENDECDVATAKYRRKKQAFWKNAGSAFNAAVGSVMLDKPRDLRMENFRVLKRFVVDEIVKYTNPYPYIEGLILRVTNRILCVEMEERERGDGQGTGYTFMRSLALFVNGFTAFSVKPLRLSTFVGFFTAVIGFISAIILVIRKILKPSIVIGYTSTVVIQLLIGGLILMSLGLVGEYVGRIYISINRSPQYVVRNTINCDISSEDFGKM